MDFRSRLPVNAETMTDLPNSSFICRLIQGNSLEAIGMQRFVFYPGMRFGSSDKWWGKPGYRHAPHEGIDICFFQTASGRFCRMDASTRIPTAADSRIVHVMEDFLGHTVVASQMIPKEGGRELLTLYAHIKPDARLRVGDRLREGELFAGIADVEYPNIPLLPHLHISVAWADQLPDYRQWTWKLLNQCGSECFIDPLKWMAFPQKTISFEFGTDLANEFIPCSRLLAQVFGQGH